MKLALFGFPQTGKTTLFQLLTGVEVPEHAAHGEAQLAVAKVPDARLERLTEMYKPKKTTPATIEYLDLPAMEKGKGAQLLPLDQLRTADALVHVVRAFADDAVIHVEDSLDPARDVASLEAEFILADMIVTEKRIEKLTLNIQKMNKAEDKKELALMQRLQAQLEEEQPLRNLELDENERAMMRGYTFLSLKPLLVVVNAGEDDADKLDTNFGLDEIAAKPHTAVVALSAKIENEIAQLDGEDAASFRADLGIETSALDRMIRASYGLLGQMSFFTVGEDEVRAWTIGNATPARKAAGAIHSDIERGFIRAELVAYDDLIAGGDWATCRDKGTLRLEGKDYVMKDGDVVNFRFNV